ncbi:Riboflavin transporter RfnT [Achromobacter mucicolens]|nr:Riboflavin transporter RfnT [Achromobacter mucicolens]
MQRFGYRLAFSLGAAVSFIGNLVIAWAIARSSFSLLTLGFILLGVYQGFGNFYRFAVVDAVDASHAARAISLVVAGGLLSAFLGPLFAQWGRDIVDAGAYAGSYLIQAAMSAAAIAVLSLLSIKTTVVRKPARSAGLPMILGQPNLLVVVAAGAIAYAVMSMLMIATPLAMLGDGHAVASVTPVIQWHAVGMFAPSFFTGSLIQRFGPYRIVLAGYVLMVVNVLIAISGTSFAAYFSALLLLGVGWNFAFIGATALLAVSTKPRYLRKVQAVNEFAVFGLTALAGLSSGWVLSAFGWTALNLVALAAVLWAAVRIAILSRKPSTR